MLVVSGFLINCHITATHLTSSILRVVESVLTMALIIPAKFPAAPPIIIVIIIIIFSFFVCQSQPFNTQQLAAASLGKEKVTHLHFYFHDRIGGANPTAMKIVDGPSSTTEFGDVYVMDDPLTEEPEATSKLLGRAQGLYMGASWEQIRLMMSMNLVFEGEEYHGSSVAVLGSNNVMSAVREMAVVGGSGLFRLARGYALAKTHTLNSTVAVVEYNVYVVHYNSQISLQ